MLRNLESLPKVCAYCGATDALTKEHVIPKSFEAENPPNWEPILVWACGRCNNEKKSRLDSKVRELFALDIIGENHETAQKLAAGKIKRSIEHSKKKGHRNTLVDLFKSMEPMTVVNAGGTASVAGMGTKLPEDYFTPWFTFVVKGLAMAWCGNRFEVDATFRWSRFYPDGFSSVREALEAAHAPEPVVIGTHTKFTYRSFDGMPCGTGMWVFEFYGGVVFDVLVLPVELVEQYDADVQSEATGGSSE